MFLSNSYWILTSFGLPFQKELLTSSCNEALIFCSMERTFSDKNIIRPVIIKANNKGNGSQVSS